MTAPVQIQPASRAMRMASIRWPAWRRPLTYLFGEVLDGRSARVAAATGVREAGTGCLGGLERAVISESVT